MSCRQDSEAETCANGEKLQCLRNVGVRSVAEPGMKQLTQIFVAMLGLAALAPAQIQHQGSPTCRIRNAPRVAVEHHPVATVSRRSAGVVRRGSSYGFRGSVRARSRCGTLRAGFYRTVEYRVWVPGYYQTQAVPARYGWVRSACGSCHWGVVEPAYTRRVYIPGHYETRTRQVRHYR